MPKTKISEYSSTANNNTDINSINIAEGCAPSGINDAIRTLMAQLKDWQSGAVSQDNSFNGAMTVSGNVILSSNLTVSSNISAGTITDPVIVGAIKEDVYTITDGAAFEVDPSNGTIQLITLGANRTPKATNFLAGESVTLMVNDGTARTLTWTDATWGTSGVVWVGGTAPTLATTGYTVLEFWKVGTQVYGALVGEVA